MHFRCSQQTQSNTDVLASAALQLFSFSFVSQAETDSEFIDVSDLL